MSEKKLSTEELIAKIVELRKETKIDPFNFGMHKYFTWEQSLQAQLQENAEYLYPKIIEIITGVLEENMGEEDLRKIAEFQIELTEKYADKLETMEQDIHKKVEDYIEIYNKAIQRLMEEEQKEGSNETEEWTKNN